MRSGARIGQNPHGITVVHKEYIRDIFPSDAFQVQLFSLNPGLANTFPWLAQITDAYEQYRFRALVFEFKSTASIFVPGAQTQSQGSVVMACDYNANNKPFTSKREMENYVGANSCTPTANMAMSVNVMNPVTDLAYIRLGTPSEKNYDLRLYDIGNFQIATVGNQVNGVPGSPQGSIGELWVTYQLELFKPKYRNSSTKVDHIRIHRLGGVGITSTGNWGNGPQFLSRPFSLLEISSDDPITLEPNGNGYFGIGCKIQNVGIESDSVLPADIAANYQRILWPAEAAGKTYSIQIVVSTSAPNGVANQMPAFQTGVSPGISVLSSPVGANPGNLVPWSPAPLSDFTDHIQPYYMQNTVVTLTQDSEIHALGWRCGPATMNCLTTTLLDAYVDIIITEIPANAMFL